MDKSNELKVTVTLTDNNGKSIPCVIEASNGRIWIAPQGYGEQSAKKGCGFPIGVELYDGKLSVMLWTDLNEGNPLIVDMENAKESCVAPQGTSPVIEDECPNCHNGTIGLENGRLVCRGECGNDFGSHKHL